MNWVVYLVMIILVVGMLALWVYTFVRWYRILARGHFLQHLPNTYYFLATVCGTILIGFIVVNSDELNSTQIGAWIGYTVGAVLSMFTIGRVVELLQQIRDAVRS